MANGHTFTGTYSTTQTLVAATSTKWNPASIANNAVINVTTSSGLYGQAGGTLPPGGWTIDNEGTVSGNPNGITLASTGTISNGLSDTDAAKITGVANGIVISGANGVVTNSGSIFGTNTDGILFGNGGTVTNNGPGIIFGGVTGIEFDPAPGTVFNEGTIGGVAVGVMLNSGGYVTNSSDGTIGALTGSGIAIDVTGANGTVIDNGLLIGGLSHYGYAAKFSSGNNLFEVQPSATIFGTIEGGTSAHTRNTLEFATGDNVTLSGLTPGVLGTDGTISDANFTTTFENFTTLQVDTGAVASLTNTTNTVSGTTLLVNGGTLVNSYNLIGNVTVTHGGTLVNDKPLTGAVYGGVGGATVLNNSNISNGSSTVAGGEAISMKAGGYVDNSPGNYIAGYDSGIDIEGKAGSVTNAGTITATSTTTGIGVYLSHGGTVSNSSTTALIQAYDFGVLITNGVGVVNNLGKISANGDSDGVMLLSGGTVTNGSTTDNTALIVGEDIGVGILGGPGTVTNFCTIIADSPTAGIGVVIASGSVVNGWSGDTAASITAQSIGVWVQGSGYVHNYGKIRATNGTNGLGVYIQGPGSIVNGSTTDTSALISGASFGVADNGDTSLKNFGKIVATSPTGVGVNVVGNASIANGLFTVVNSTTTISTHAAYIYGARAGVAVIGNMTLNNQGSIESNPLSGYGAVFGNGTIVNGASGNSHALIKGHIGLLGAGNVTLSNWGTVSADPAGGSGVQALGSASITNAGSIVGGSFGVDVGGSVSILNTGTIAGYYYFGLGGAGIDLGANSAGSTGIITNGSSNASTVISAALIEGPQFGIVDFGSGTVTNYGTILAGDTIASPSNTPGTLEQGIAVLMLNGTVVNGASNDSAATIAGEAVGIFSPGPATITDWGTILGGVDAISLVSGNNIVSLAGANAAIGGESVFGTYGGGSIVGGTFPGSTNKLEFGQGAYGRIEDLVKGAYSAAATGVLVTQGDHDATFSNFGTIQVDGTSIVGGAGGVVGFGGDYDTIASGVTVNVANGGYAFVEQETYLLNKGSISITHGGTLLVDDFATLVNAHIITGDVTLAAAGNLTNTSTGTITGDAAVYVSGLGIAECLPSNLQNLDAPIDPNLVPVGNLNFFAYVTNASGGVITGPIGVQDNSPGGLALLNSGSITGTQFGVDVSGASNTGFGIIANGLQFPFAGPVFVPGAVISGGQAGVYASTPYAIVLNDGTIIGQSGIGVDLTNGGIVADAGTIIGNNGTAVALGPDAPAALYLAPGYSLQGAVVTSNPFDDTLVLGEGAFAGLTNAVGTIGGIGTTFNFGNVYVAGYPHPAVWSITGANTIAAGYTLSGNPSQTGVLVFAPSATLDIEGFMGEGIFNCNFTEYGVDLNLNGPGGQELILGRAVASYDYETNGDGPGFIAQGGTFFGTIEGVGAGDKIEIGGVSLGSNAVANYNSNSHQLIISSNNGTDYTFTDIRAPGVTHFSVSVDPNNGNVLLIADNGPTAGTTGTISGGTVLSDPTTLDLPLNALVTPGAIGDAETITGFSTFTAHGTVSSDGHGGLIYTPTTGASGADSFTFTAKDQFGSTGNGTVNLTLNNTPATPFSGTGSSNINVGSGNAAVTLSGNFNTVGSSTSNGVVTVSGTSSGTTVTLGNGNDTVNLTGFSNAVTLGSGNNIITLAGGGGANSVTVGAGADVITDTNSGADTFNLNGSNAFLAVSGAGALAFINGGNDQISLSGAAATSATIKVGATGGSAEITGFGTGDTVDLVGGLGFTSAAAIAAYANNPSNSDGHGGTLLHYNNGAIDFVGLTPGHFTAANFSVT